MLVIQTLRSLRNLPSLMVLGLGVMALGGALDVVAHLGPSGHHVADGFVAEHVAHLIGIAGMSIVLAGVVAHGARRHRRRPAAPRGGLDNHAHR